MSEDGCSLWLGHLTEKSCDFSPFRNSYLARNSWEGRQNSPLSPPLFDPTIRNIRKTISVINGTKRKFVTSSLVISYWVSISQTKLIEVMILL